MSASMLRVAIPTASAILMAAMGFAQEDQARFEVAAWVDHFDFAPVMRDGQPVFDTETLGGCLAILDHVQETGATTILWRNCAGGNMRYQSAIESGHLPDILDKRRIADTRGLLGWVRYGVAEPDIVRAMMDECRERGLVPGIHWPFEESHGHLWTISQFNFDHPELWARTVDGRPWCGRCSIAYEETIEHKLALVDELLDRGATRLFIDLYRSGAWSPAYEYVPPVLEAWRERYGEDPPGSTTDERWARHVSGYVTAYMRRLRAHLDASGREVELMVGVPAVSMVEPDYALLHRGADWRAWIDEGLIDTLVVNFFTWDADRPFESTRELGRELLDFVDGRCRVLWPVRAYDYGGYGMPSYSQATGLPQDEIAVRLMQMAAEEGADGVSLECVDYRNYSDTTRPRMKALSQQLNAP